MNLYMNIIVLVTTVQQIILKCITLKQKTFLFCIILKDLKYANGLADGSGSEHLKKNHIQLIAMCRYLHMAAPQYVSWLSPEKMVL